MPTLVACVVLGMAIVLAVGLQAPAVSVGLRWKPEPRPRGRAIYIEPLEFNWPLGAAQQQSSWPAMVTWILAVLVMLALLVVIARWFMRRSRRVPMVHVARIGTDSGVLTEADAKILQSSLAAAIALLSSDRDLSNAVIQAWQGLQDAASTAGLHRRPSETASEFTARILYRSRGSAEPIAVLLSLYQRVRFGGHVPHAGEIAAARQSLAVLVKLWEADFPRRRQTT
ncbi:MAG: DUF4129 domain-containing protein [Gemmatimonas sp.]